MAIRVRFVVSIQNASAPKTGVSGFMLPTVPVMPSLLGHPDSTRHWAVVLGCKPRISRMPGKRSATALGSQTISSHMQSCPAPDHGDLREELFRHTKVSSLQRECDSSGVILGKKGLRRKQRGVNSEPADHVAFPHRLFHAWPSPSLKHEP